MIDFIEELLLAWGHEQVSPSIEVGIPSPLGQMGEGAGGVGGHRCLSLTEQHAAAEQRVLAVEQALRDIVSEMSQLGRQLDNLAGVRYAMRPALPLAEQYRRLGISRNTYRTRLDRLHVEVAGRYPDLEGMIDRLAASTPAAQARLAWVDKARRIAREADKARSQRLAEAKRQARQIQAAAQARRAG